jgi:hypothetical protein
VLNEVREEGTKMKSTRTAERDAFWEHLDDVLAEVDTEQKSTPDTDTQPFDALLWTTRKRAEAGLARVVGGHPVAELLYLHARETHGEMREVAAQRRDVVSQVLKDKELWQPEFHEMYDTKYHGFTYRFKAVGAGVLHGTGVVVMHRTITDTERQHRVFDTVLGKMVEGQEDQYIVASANSSAQRIYNEDLGIYAKTAMNLVGMIDEAQAAGLLK